MRWNCGFKKVALAAEQDTAAGQLARSLWKEQAGKVDPEKLIFLEESGVSTDMTRR